MLQNHRKTFGQQVESDTGQDSKPQASKLSFCKDESSTTTPS